MDEEMTFRQLNDLSRSTEPVRGMAESQRQISGGCPFPCDYTGHSL